MRAATGANEAVVHRWRVLNLAGKCVAAAVQLIPRRYRFRAAFLFARAAEPFLRRTEAYRRQAALRFDGPAEIALHFVLQALTKNGIEYDPVINVRGYDDLVSALAGPRGVLLAAPHAALVLLLLRHFHDHGLRDVVSVSADPHMRIPGTQIVAGTVQPSPTFLLTVRTRLRTGGLTCAMVDRPEHEAGRTREFDTADGKLLFAPALLQLAARCDARAGFFEVHVERGGLVGSIVMPPTQSAERLTLEFIDFVRAYLAARSKPAARRIRFAPESHTSERREA